MEQDERYPLSLTPIMDLPFGEGYVALFHLVLAVFQYLL
jgi:hypothetical protein